MTTTTIVTAFGALAPIVILLNILVLVLRRRRLKRYRQMDLYDSAMRSKWDWKG